MKEKLAYIESINTIRPNHHFWSLEIEYGSGVIAENVETSVRKCIKALTKARKEFLNSKNENRLIG